MTLLSQSGVEWGWGRFVLEVRLVESAAFQFKPLGEVVQMWVSATLGQSSAHYSTPPFPFKTSETKTAIKPYETPEYEVDKTLEEIFPSCSSTFVGNLQCSKVPKFFTYK